MENVEFLIKSINDESGLNIATTNLSLFSSNDYNIEEIKDNFDYKRYFHFIVIDKPFDLKKLFRGLRNGGYLISKIEFDENELYDMGFSVISKVDEWKLMKKVHSWNDF